MNDPVIAEPTEGGNIRQHQGIQPHQHASRQAGEDPAATDPAYIETTEQGRQKQYGAGKGDQADGSQRLAGGDQAVTAISQQQNEQDQAAPDTQQPGAQVIARQQA